MTNEAADILRKAKELIETKGWCQYDYAPTAEGNSCNYYSPEAASFCISGAIWRASDESDVDVFVMEDYAFQAIQDKGFESLADFNDTPGRTKEEALAELDRAIALAEAGNA